MLNLRGHYAPSIKADTGVHGQPSFWQTIEDHYFRPVSADEIARQHEYILSKVRPGIQNFEESKSVEDPSPEIEENIVGQIRADMEGSRQNCEAGYGRLYIESLLRGEERRDKEWSKSWNVEEHKEGINGRKKRLLLGYYVDCVDAMKDEKEISIMGDINSEEQRLEKVISRLEKSNIRQIKMYHAFLIISFHID